MNYHQLLIHMRKDAGRSLFLMGYDKRFLQVKIKLKTQKKKIKSGLTVNTSSQPFGIIKHYRT